MTDQAELLPGTLDLFILKAVSLGSWNRRVEAIARAFAATPEEV